MASYTCNICGTGFEGRGCNCDALPDKPHATSMTKENISLLATFFVGGLAEALTPEQFHEFCRKTREEFDDLICHSHDYCDANVVMMEAFELTVGRPLDMESDDDMTLVNLAWSYAKRFIAGKEI